MPTALAPVSRCASSRPTSIRPTKWRPENSAEIFTDYLNLTKSGPTGLNGIALVVWPETAVPFLLADSPEALSLIAEALPEGTSLLVGSARLVEERDAQGALTATRIYNSLLVIDDKGEVLDGYDKIHLVPFGEYLPFQDFLESLGFMQLTGVRGGFSAGTGPRLLAIPGAPPASPLICYEIIFPDDVVEKSARPGWLLNITNDAWFGSSAGPYQHFHQARVRAVEQGLPVVRAANTGISAMIDPYGRILAEIDLGEKGAIDSELPKAVPQTLFAQARTPDRNLDDRACFRLLARPPRATNWGQPLRSMWPIIVYGCCLLDGCKPRPYERPRRGLHRDYELASFLI